MGLNNLHDGLAGDQLKASGLQDVTQNALITGSLTVGQGFSFAGSLTAAGNFSTTGSIVVGGQALAAGNGFVATGGSPYSLGLIVPMTARTNISGGMFVSASGGLAYAAPTSTKWPIGVAVATAASGAAVQVILNGIAPVIAEGTVAVGGVAMMGAGAGLNCITPVTGAVAASGARLFGVLDAAASGTTATVFIQF